MDVLAGTAGGLHRVTADRVTRAAEGDIAALAFADGTVWAAVDGRTVARGAPDGQLGPVASADRPLHCLLPAADGVFAGTAEAGLLRLRDGDLATVPGFLDVEGRGSWYTPWGGPPDTRSLAGDGEALYANVHVGGIPRSLDGGATWVPTIPVDADVHQVVVARGMVLAASARGLALSDDAGASWSWRTDGLHATYARAVTVAGDTVLVSVSEGPGGRRSALYRGALGLAGPLERCRDGLPEWFSGNVDTGCLTATGATVAAADAGTVYQSTDAGRTWDVLAQGLPEIRCLLTLP